MYAGRSSPSRTHHGRQPRQPTQPTQSTPMTRNTDTQTRTESRYTCTENTGTAAVPDLRQDKEDRDERDDMDELVWSHRL